MAANWLECAVRAAYFVPEEAVEHENAWIMADAAKRYDDLAEHQTIYDHISDEYLQIVGYLIMPVLATDMRKKRWYA